MPESVKRMNLGKANQTRAKSKEHIPSKVQADTLFTFTSEVDYLITTIKNMHALRHPYVKHTTKIFACA